MTEPVSPTTAPTSSIDPALPAAHAFSQLQLVPALARAVADMGYTTMTPIQAQAIPVVLQGRDVMIRSQTGPSMC